MEIEISVYGDLYDNDNELKTFMHANDLLVAICDTRSKIHKRLKTNPVTPKEKDFLIDILSTLDIRGVDLF